jgi:hypothetical protein
LDGWLANNTYFTTICCIYGITVAGLMQKSSAISKAAVPVASRNMLSEKYARTDIKLSVRIYITSMLWV